jgi:alanine dehydrogenase
MVIGTLKEEPHIEKRVALSPAGVQTLIAAGQTVYVQEGAGLGSRFTDEEYRAVGATTAFSKEEILNRCQTILKVSSPQQEELKKLEADQILFSFFHLSVSKKRTIELLLQKKVTGIAYELIENAYGDLAVLQSMSEIAGQVSMQVAGHYLQGKEGGRGILLGSVPGVPPASVLILGAGTVGRTAARIAIGMGASVTVLDKDLSRLRKLEELFQWRFATGIATSYNIKRALGHADVVIGAVLMKAEKAPHVMTEEMVRGMKPGSVIVDVSIDEGGCIETSRPTTLDDPIFIQHDVIHYCVPNIPSTVARTATVALTNALLPYVMEIAERGPERAFQSNSGLAKGVCTFNGFCTNTSIAGAYELKAIDLQLQVRRKFETSKN